MLTVITVNYNGKQVTSELLDSLQHVNFDGEVIVVDNGSVEDEACILKQKYQEIVAIRSEVNLGFAGGNNLGIDAAKGDILFFLNNDTTVIAGFDKAIEDFFDHNPQVGVVCPKICFYDHPDTIQFAGYTELTRITLRNHLIGWHEVDRGQYNTAHESPYAHGAAMAFRKCVIQDVGKMPECYFLYYEELDWSVLVRKSGWKIWYAPVTTIYHKESWSTGKNSPLRAYYLTKNRLKFAKRNLKGVDKIFSIAFQILISAPINIVRNIKQKRPDIVKAIVKGIFSTI